MFPEGEVRQVSTGRQTGGRFVGNGVSAKLLIMLAYDRQGFQIAGGPSWLDEQAFNVSARDENIAGRLTDAQLMPRLQALLRDRFGLKIREEPRQMSGYALVTAKDGHKLTPSSDSQKERETRAGRGVLVSKRTTLTVLARQLTTILGRNVIDKTGLTGKYDIDLRWTPDPAPSAGAVPTSQPPDSPQGAEFSGPTVFTALQKQLGLRLESIKGPVPVLVIDSIHQPTGN